MALIEENGYYEINCDKALWNSDEQNDWSHRFTASLLKDIDWLFETDIAIFMVEYKNGIIFQPKKAFNPHEDKYIDNIANKYYDTLHFLTLLEKTKPKNYIYVVEYPNSDSVSRKALRNKIVKKLPFKLQKELSKTVKLIESFDVLSIDEWNEKYPDFPINRTSKPFSKTT